MKLPIFLILLFTGSFVFAQEQTQDGERVGEEVQDT